MLNTLHTSGPAETADTVDVVTILVAAFRNDQAVRALYPTELEYQRYFPGFLMAFGGRAFEDGFVDRAPGNLAAALWFPPGLEPDGEGIMTYLEASVPADRLGRFAAGMEIQAGLHPQEHHWYLPWMGVLPQAQGAGVGSALLGEGLARADADGLPAYVEATNRRNAAFYARHGFQETAVVDAPGYPEIIAMWRPARAGALQ